MAYKRSVCSRATLLARRFNTSFSYISHDHEDNCRKEEPILYKIHDKLAQGRYFGTYTNSSWGNNAIFRQQRAIFYGNGNGVNFHRYMSTSNGGGSDNAEYYNDIAGVISDSPIEAIASQAPAVSEVAIAAADSAYPVAALQYLIDGVHCFTGLNWWASIALTTVLIRGFTVPFLISQLKATSKLTLMRPRLEEIRAEMEAKAMDPKAVADCRQRMSEVFKEYGVTPFTPLKGILIQGPVFISFFFAISNMAEKVPSFKSGGAFWFTDLTVPDNMYILPVLTALTFLINVEFNMQEGLEGNPIATTMKKFSRGMALLTVPVTMNFPQAIFCYWITSNIFSFVYGSVLKIPGVKKALGVPEILVTPPDSSQDSKQSGLSLFQGLKQFSIATQNTESICSPTEQAKPTEAKKSPSSAVLSQRLRSLERQVKQRKENKKQ